VFRRIDVRLLVGMVYLCASWHTGARAAAPNSLEIVITGGPRAGTYKAPDVICLHVKKQGQFSAASKVFDAQAAGALSEAGISVANVDETGAKRGEVRIAFIGSSPSQPTIYDVVIPRDSPGPLTVTKTATQTDLSFQGQAKGGIQLRVTAKCGDIDEM
jgi:hypothetical protein